jgi:hypothetical protein
MTFSGPWPQDPRLDPFRDAVWELSRDGQVEAYLTTQVFRMRSFPFFWVKREWLWYQVNWLDGRRDRMDEDYGPDWHTVTELEAGKFEHDSVAGLVFDARPVDAADRDTLWDRYGPPS